MHFQKKEIVLLEINPIQVPIKYHWMVPTRINRISKAVSLCGNICIKKYEMGKLTTKAPIKASRSSCLSVK